MTEPIGDPYEPEEIQYLRENDDGFVMICTLCQNNGIRFGLKPKSQLNAMELHYDMEHPGEEIQLTSVWTGDGPAPKPNRRQRRAGVRNRKAFNNSIKQKHQAKKKAKRR